MWKVLDHPNERSLHLHPVPRVGGIGLLAGISFAWTLLTPGTGMVVWVCLLLLCLVSCLDDARGVSILLRLFVHLVAATAVSYQALWDTSAWWTTPIAALAICWMINLYNFMDGSDGLAGGMAMFGFFAYGVASWIAGNTGFALLNFSICAAAMAFLIFNFHPAKVFLGDAGSIPLGYLAGAFGLTGYTKGYWSLWFPVLVFSPFVVDATLTLVRRLFCGHRIWHAHRDHYYQRLVQLGWGHRNTALAEYLLMAICVVAGLVILRFPSITLVVSTLLLCSYAVLIIAISSAWSRARGAKP